MGFSVEGFRAIRTRPRESASRREQSLPVLPVMNFGFFGRKTSCWAASCSSILEHSKRVNIYIYIYIYVYIYIYIYPHTIVDPKPQQGRFFLDLHSIMVYRWTLENFLLRDGRPRLLPKIKTARIRGLGVWGLGFRG